MPLPRPEINDAWPVREPDPTPEPIILGGGPPLKFTE